MSMKLSPDDLRVIANKVEAIESMGIDVKVFVAADHQVYLEKKDGQTVVVGVTDKVSSSVVKPVMR